MRQSALAEKPGIYSKNPEIAARRSISKGTYVFHGLLFLLIAIVVVVVILAAYQGRSYYSTPITERYRSDLHQQYKPGGTIGHPLGIAGSVLLVGLLSYSIRKRFRALRGAGPLRRWLQFHIFCGTAGPALILLHTSFKMRGIVAISFWSMMVVFVSGVIGRYLYAQIPHALSGQELHYQDLNKEIGDLNSQLAFLMKPEHFEKVQSITNFQTGARKLSGLSALFLIVADDLRWLKQRRSLNAILRTYTELNPEDHRNVAHLVRLRKLQMRRISLLKTSHELFRHWHVIHLPLAQTMYLTMAIHIAVAVMTGYF